MAGSNMDESYWSRKVFEEFEFSVSRLNFQGRFLGNGFVVHCDEEGTCLLMTCAHIFEDVRDPWSATVDAYFSRSNDPLFQARVLYLDETRDLLLLRADGVPTQITPLEFYDAPIIRGWNVVSLAFITLGSSFILEPGTFFGQITSEPDHYNPYVVCDYTSRPGSSGSPVILAGINRVVGVHVISSRGCTSSVGVRVIREFLEAIPGVPIDVNFTIRRMLIVAAG